MPEGARDYILRNALFASALTLAASCLAASVGSGSSFGCNVGDGGADVGGVDAEEGEKLDSEDMVVAGRKRLIP